MGTVVGLPVLHRLWSEMTLIAVHVHCPISLQSSSEPDQTDARVFSAKTHLESARVKVSARDV